MFIMSGDGLYGYKRCDTSAQNSHLPTDYMILFIESHGALAPYWSFISHHFSSRNERKWGRYRATSSGGSETLGSARAPLWVERVVRRDLSEMDDCTSDNVEKDASQLNY